jgi:hypothetical protein
MKFFYKLCRKLNIEACTDTLQVKGGLFKLSMYLQRHVAVRVTKLGEFSPNGRLFTLGTLMKITKVAQTSVLLFSRSVDYALIL